jgi:hypothetical protein
LTYRKDKEKYFYWKASFAIALRKDDKSVLESIKEYFGSGNISYSRKNIRYEITDPEILNKDIIPFFEKHQLIGKKKNDFNLWKEAIRIIVKNKRKSINSSKGCRGFINKEWNKDDLVRLSQIRENMQLYKGGGKTRIFKHTAQGVV